jgi:hypothetical protein
MTNTPTISKKLFFALFGVCLFTISTTVKAQYANAKDYPFIAGQEEFQYISGGTLVTGIHTDDATITNIPFGFSFPFCNSTYTNGSVSSNGWLSLSTSTGTGLGVNNDNLNFAQFSSNNSLPVLMPFWDDLGYFIGSPSPSAQASYITTGTSPNKVFTFEWRNWSWDFSPIPGTMSIQLKLYESGSFKFLYKRESGAVASAQSVNTSPAWFGASIGFAKNTSDFQFLTGSTQYVRSLSTGPFKVNIDSRPFSNQMYLWMAPCAGVQSAIVVGPDEICPDSAFTVAAVTENMALPGSVIWYYSDDGSTWATASATTGILGDAIKKSRWYKAKVTCGSQTYTTAPKLVQLAPHYRCYCPNASTVLTSFAASAMDIGNLNLIGYKKNDTLLKNYEPSLTLTANIYGVKGYSDFTKEFSQLPVLYKDSTYIINANSISYGTAPQSGGYLTAYIDYNHNNIFDDSERIVYGQMGNVLPKPYVVQDTFTVKKWAEYGLTRMRVVLKAGTTFPDSCGLYSEGETEDYLVNIDFPPCAGPVDPGKLEVSDTSMCAGYAYLVTDTTYEKKQGFLQKAWQVSADGVYWTNMTGVAGNDTINRVFPGGQPLYYRMGMICTRTNDTAFTDSVRINIKPSYKCYCYSQAEGGAENDTSDIGAFKLSVLDINDGGTHLLNPKAYRMRTDRTDLEPLELNVDSVYNFYVFHSMPRHDHADAKITVFVDFNNDHKYDIPYERIFTGFTAIGYHTLIGNVIIPNNVIVNMPTGLRVILNNNVAPNPQSDSACGPYTSGETEDYIVVFRRPFQVSVDDANDVKHMSVFPNPTNGKASVQFSSEAATTVSLKVTDLAGRVMVTESYNHSGGIFRHDVDLSTQAKGMYLIEVSAAGKHYMSKLVVQ